MHDYHGRSEVSIGPTISPATGANATSPRLPAPARVPPHIETYTWQSCTLRELGELLVSILLPDLQNPPVSTRLCFRMVYRNTSEWWPLSSKGPRRCRCGF